MAFTAKNWQDAPSTATPLSAVALEDLETRVTDYSDDIAAHADPDTDLVDGVAIELAGKKKRRVPIADKAAYDLREFYSGSSQPADALGAIHDGLDKAAAGGGTLLIPDSEEPWTVTGPIVPPPNTRMTGPTPSQFSERVGGSHGTAHYQWPVLPNTIGEAWIRLANGSNCPILTNDYANAVGKRGPQRDTATRYWQWFTAQNIVFDHNGANQTGSLVAVDIRQAWGMSFPGCRLVMPRGLGWSFTDCNVCDGPGTMAVGGSENVANGTATTSSGSPSVTSASGTWAVGDLIAGTGIPGGTYLSAVAGGTLTLAKTSDGSAQNATASGTVSVAKVTFIADYLAKFKNCTDARWPEVALHGAKNGILLDASYGMRISGQSGYAIGGYNLEMVDTLTSGCFQNKLDLRCEQATKHNARIGQNVNDNDIHINAYQAGLFSSAADADGGWVNVYDDGKHNLVYGTGGLRSGTPATVTAVMAYGANALMGNSQGLAGGAYNTAAADLVAYRGSASSSNTYSSRGPEAPALYLPGKDFVATDGSTSALADYNGTLHKVRSLPDAATTSVIQYCTIPRGTRYVRVHAHFVNLNAGVSGNIRVQLGYAGASLGGGVVLGNDVTTVGPTTVAIGANSNVVLTTFGGQNVSLIAGDVAAFRLKRLGADGSDTLAADVGLLGLKLTPVFWSG